MNRSSSKSILFFAALIILQGSLSFANARSEKFQKLLKSTSEKKVPVVEFTGESLDRYAKQDRDFHLVVLITTENPRYNCEQCPQINQEFNRMASMYRDSFEGGFQSQKFLENPAFFGKCEAAKCMDFYKGGNYRTFPVMLHFRPSNKNLTEIEYRKIDQITTIYDDPSAEAAGRALGPHLGYQFITPTPIYKLLALYGTAIVALILIGRSVYPKVKPTLESRNFWFLCCLAVFMFVMAGTVFNSIHRPPLFYRHPQTKQALLVYPSSRQQFVLEGIIVSVLFVTGGMFFVGFTSHVPTFKDPAKQRGMFVICALGFFTCWYWIMTFFKVKHAYYPLWKLS
jgi:oligosaccharyltransferase complex subunit gamma